MKRLGMMLAVLLLTGCGKPEETYEPTFAQRGTGQPADYIVGIYPEQNPKRLAEAYAPIVDRLNALIPQARFRLEVPRSYEEFEKLLYSRHFDLALSNPYQTVRSSRHGYRVFAKMCNDELSRGIILVRKDGRIRKVADLKGGRISFPASTALTSTMMPEFYLEAHGLHVNRDVEILYVGSQESSIMNLVLGHVQAAGTSALTWRLFRQDQPRLAAQLDAKWQTEPLISSGWIARNDIPPVLVDEAGKVLLGLSRTENGRTLLAELGIACFAQANDATYEPVRQYLKKFSDTVRHIDY